MNTSDQCVNVIRFIPVDSSGNCKRGTVPCISFDFCLFYNLIHSLQPASYASEV